MQDEKECMHSLLHFSSVMSGEAQLPQTKLNTERIRCRELKQGSVSYKTEMINSLMWGYPPPKPDNLYTLQNQMETSSIMRMILMLPVDAQSEILFPALHWWGQE